MTYRATTLLIPDGCPLLAVGPDGEPYWRCGQEWRHDGDCTWWTPGGYLPPPLISPLGWLIAKLRSGPWHHCCPMCGALLSYANGEASLTIYCDAEDAEREEIRWTFRPCGCEGRTLAVDSS